MEDSRDEIERLRNGYGYGPKEAEAMYRLTQARSLCEEIYDGDADAAAAAGKGNSGTLYNEIHLTAKVRPHFDALENLILRRALDRTYPEGWGKLAE